VLAQACLPVLLLVSDRAGISEWGWRVAFVVGGVAGVASLLWARGSKRGVSVAHGAAVMMRGGAVSALDAQGGSAKG
jgi:MHS family alpha-ketoglutarate permease-like MFS transporter